jgi:hypothetical protein
LARYKRREIVRKKIPGEAIVFQKKFKKFEIRIIIEFFGLKKLSEYIKEKNKIEI